MFSPAFMQYLRTYCFYYSLLVIFQSRGNGKIEIVVGSGVFLTREQLREIKETSGGLKQVLRNTVTTMFDRAVLKDSCCLGKGKEDGREALPNKAVKAMKGKYETIFLH
jgi:hypothetical protein